MREGANRPKMTAALREVILSAAEQVGENGSGRDGLVGYMRRLAIRRMVTFVAMLREVLEIEVKNSKDPEPELDYLGINESEEEMRALAISGSLPMLHEALMIAMLQVGEDGRGRN